MCKNWYFLCKTVYCNGFLLQAISKSVMEQITQSNGCRFELNTEKKQWFYTTREGMGLQGMGVSVEINGELHSCISSDSISEKSEETDDSNGRCTQFRITHLLPIYKVRVELCFRSYHDAPFLSISLRLHNTGDAAVNLGKCKLIHFLEQPGIVLGDPAELRLLCHTAWVLGSAVKVAGNETGEASSKTVGLLYAPSIPTALNCSFLTFDRADTVITYLNDRGEPTLEACCDFAGFSLKPDCAIVSETLGVEIGDDPFASLERWASRVAAHYQPRFATHPSLGWVGGWTWRDGFMQETYEEIVLENIAAITKKLAGFGIRNIWVSIANIKDMLPGLWMEENRETFPHGLRWLVKKLEALEMKLGLWVAPFWIPDGLCDLFEEHRENLLKREGKPIHYDYKLPYGKSGKLPVSERVGFYSLDGSHPSTQRFLRQVFDHYRELGVRFFMTDFLFAGSGSTPGRFLYDEYWDREKVSGPEVYREALKVIREAAGPETYLLSSTGTTFQNIGCVDAVRVGPDIGEGRPLIETMGAYPATYTIHGWDLIRTVAQAMACSYFTDRKFYYNDSFSVLTVDKPIPLREARATVSMFAISSGPVMLGDDIATISDERLALVKKCLPPYHRMARPIDLFTSTAPDFPKVFHLPVVKDWDEWHIVTVLNANSAPLRQRIPFDVLGLPAGMKYVAFDFWNEEYLGEVQEAMDIELSGQSVKVVRLCKARSHPWLIASDMHVTQGGVEVEHLEWDSARKILKGICTRPAGERGNLYFRLPKGWKPLSYEGLNVAKVCHDGTVIAMKRIAFPAETATWQLALEPYGEAVERDYSGV